MADTVRDMAKALEALLYELDKYIVGGPVGERMEQSRAALSAHKAAGDGWRPIAEAPKDGRYILAYIPRGDRECIVKMRWLVRIQDWSALGATHYMPLPSPPASGEGEKNACLSG